MSMDLPIIAETDAFLVVDKPKGLPTVPLKKSDPYDETLLSLLAKEYPETVEINPQKPWEGGVLHRLDTATSGLVTVARTEEALKKLRMCQSAGLFQKEYLALSTSERIIEEGFPDFPYDDPETADGPVIIGSLFRPYGDGRRQVRPVTENESEIIRRKAGPKWYMTKVEYLENGLYSCTITAGFRHQIRAHMAWSNHPIDGDRVYRGREREGLALRCWRIRFPDPETGLPREFETRKEF